MLFDWGLESAHNQGMEANMNSRSLRRTRRRARVSRLFLIFSGIVALWIVASWAARSLDARGGNAKTLTLHADMQASDVIVYRYSDKP